MMVEILTDIVRLCHGGRLMILIYGSPLSLTSSFIHQLIIDLEHSIDKSLSSH